ncbi:hypothetical protein KL925_001953 [Ogataea polymorpha]|nr:hypothetical protein KL925_001953 [Ogataea polymorpha]
MSSLALKLLETRQTCQKNPAFDLEDPWRLAIQLRDHKEPNRRQPNNVLNLHLKQIIDDPSARSFKLQRENISPVELNILIERTLAELYEHSEGKEVLTLEEAKRVKNQIEELKASKTQLLEKLSEGLQSQLFERFVAVDKDLEFLQAKLSSHEILVSQLGYVQDMFLDQNAAFMASDVERSLEGLVSKVVSMSVQNNVELPEPNIEKMRSLTGRIEWCSNCIAALVNGSKTTPISETHQFTKDVDNKQESSDVEELRTALSDLQFAHNYLTRKFEDERELHNTVLSELRQKLSQSQELLDKSNSELSKQTSQLLKLELQNSELQMQLANKQRETIDQAKHKSVIFPVNASHVIPRGPIFCGHFFPYQEQRQRIDSETRVQEVGRRHEREVRAGARSRTCGEKTVAGLVENV